MKFATWAAYVSLFAALPLYAQEDASEQLMLDEVTVSAKSHDLTGIADSASEGVITAQDLAARPLLRAAEVMETIPGMIVTQHSGDGKANQYFLRGFNLDHGSDFATFVNGMPINNVTHAHGQGYTDLNFLIPELVDQMRYKKGSYAAEDGDLAVTGAARLEYARSLAAPFVDLTLGEHNYRRALVAGSQQIGKHSLLGAVELVGNDGPWVKPEGLDKRNAVVRLSSGDAANGYDLTAMVYEADWTATEQVPERAILNSEISRYGTFASTDGGKTHRYSLSGSWAASDSKGGWRGNGYVVDYGLNLFSTPAGILDSQHEQVDRRLIWGGQLAHDAVFDWSGISTETSLGMQLREDRIGRVGLFQTVARQRTNVTREDRITEDSLGLFGEARTQWLPWLRSTLGLRWDQQWASVSPVAGAFNMVNGGNVQGHQLSPKFGIAFGPYGKTEYFANWGRGFHSNDARGATSRTNSVDGSAINPTPLIVKSESAELGVRTELLPGWHSSLALWRMKLASELVFIGDEGVTEPKGASHRHGLEWSNYYSNGRGFILDGDVAYAQARFDAASNGGTHVPNAIPLTASLAATLERGEWFGGVRLRYIGAYDLEETGQQKSKAFWTTNLKLGYRWDKSLQFSLDVLNLFNSRANDIEYWGASCTTSEGAGCNGGDGIDGKLIHPLEPRMVRLGVRMGF